MSTIIAIMKSTTQRVMALWDQASQFLLHLHKNPSSKASAQDLDEVNDLIRKGNVDDGVNGDQ